MKGNKRTASWMIVLMLALTAALLTGCSLGGDDIAPTVVEEIEGYISELLDISYDGALPASSQLAMGTILLAETEQAVTPEQAAALLPLWQVLRGDSLQGSAEVDAVLSQIEHEMTSEQLSAIAAMQLTREDWLAWAQERGLNLSTGPGGGAGVPGGQGGGLEPDARETRRAEMESLSPEEQEQRRAELRETAEAGGASFPGGDGTGDGSGSRRGGSSGLAGLGPLLDAVIELLSPAVTPEPL